MKYIKCAEKRTEIHMVVVKGKGKERRDILIGRITLIFRLGKHDIWYNARRSSRGK